MPNNFYAVILVGIILLIWGLPSAWSGNMTVTNRRSRGAFRLDYEVKYTVIYEGRALGIVLALTGAILLLLVVVARLNKPLLTPDQVVKYAIIVGIGGGIISALLLVINSFMRGDSQLSSTDSSAPKQGINQPMSLQQAAKYLHISEDELRGMAENGGIRAHYVNGKYIFDGEILQDLRDVLSRK